MSYKINKQYQLGANQGDPRVAKRYYVIAHESGNQNDVNDANAVLHEVQYMKSHYGNAYTTHFVGGGGKIYEIGTPGYVSWGALNANPYAVAQVELARTKNADTFKKDYAAYVWILRTMANKYGIPLTLDGSGHGIKSHRWVTNNYGGDHTDPYDYLARWGITKAKFAHDLEHGVDGVVSSHTVKKTVRKTYNANDYIQYNPVIVKTLADINAYKEPAFGKQKPAKNIKKGTKLEVSEVKKYAKVTRLKTKYGWISGRIDLVANLYYFDHKMKHIRVTGDDVHGYSDKELKHKITSVGKGVYTVEKIVLRASGLPVAQLKSGLYITTRKNITKKVD